ncbi:MAG: putative DNA-binding domain-containing protein [Burkholderiales bacterium]|uniref:HvfC/BufC family peptide modification chaperone n=1 Tax=Inhella sp. TaxID=1921806 RepID=UPI001AD041D0|nr:putative DNA-binding domain-containing protein [Burkholderiales bacterium]
MTNAADDSADQAALVAWIWGEAGAQAPASLTAVGPRPLDRCLSAYREHAKALAVRALAARYPLLQAWLGDPDFAGLAWAFAREHPPREGDMNRWGGELKSFLQALPGMDEEPPWLAALDDDMHRLASAADDAEPDAMLWLRLQQTDAARLRLRWSQHLRLVPSLPSLNELLAAGNEALDGLDGNAATATMVVWRRGWKPCRSWLPDDEAHWLGLQLGAEPACASLAEAVVQQLRSYPQFDLGVALQRAWTRGWLLGADETAPRLTA